MSLRPVFSDRGSYIYIYGYGGKENGTGLPHYNAIFGVHRKRQCYK